MQRKHRDRTSARQRLIRPLMAVVALALLTGAIFSATTAPTAAAGTILTFTPVADTYVNGSYPATSYGSDTILKVGSSPIRESYLKFDLTGLSGSVASARLRLYVSTNASAVTGGSVARMSNTGWTESTVTYNTRPAIDGAVLSTLGAVGLDQWVELDVTGAVTGNGTLSLGLTSPSSDAVYYASRVDSLHAPRLVVTLADGGVLPATPTPTPTTAPVAPTPTPTTAPTAPTPTPTTAPVVTGRRPYAADSPWNTLLGPSPVYDELSAQYITALGGYFGSDPTQFTMPVYEVTSSTPLKTIKLSGVYSNVYNNNQSLIKLSAPTLQLPIPSGAQPAKGSDAQIILWNRDTGDEWGFWSATVSADGSYSAVNGYHYNTNWSGVPPKGFGSRGAGVPYLTGLIRPWEIAQGQIDHAIAFAYDVPTSQYVYPATKSDGGGVFPDMPEGTRLQLNPALTDANFTSWGLSPAGKIIARALQQYGMIIIDKSGHPKVYAEYEGTAHWNGTIKASTISTIPYSAFRVLNLP